MKKMLLAGVALVPALLLAATAQAQEVPASASQDAPAPEAPATQIEEIIVTGFRSVARPIAAIKQDSVVIVDSLTQAEIERLPDRSLADVLDRVVGVSSDRGFSSSQPRSVTLRGFDARYNSMDIDGNIVWNSSRNNRGTQLDVFPAAVINQINVFKTITTAMDANSIGGHLELRTLRAFDGGTGTYLRARAGYGVYDQSGTPDSGRPSFRADAAYKFTFGPENNLGIVLGAEYQQHEFYDVYNETTAYAQVGDIDVVNGSNFGGIFQQNQDRLALFAKAEARSQDQYYAFVSASYFGDALNQTFNRGGPFIQSSRVTNAAPGRGDFTRATAENYFEDYRLNRDTLLIGSGLDYRLGENTSLFLRAAYTSYDHDEKLFRSERFQVGNLAGSYAFGETGPDITYDDASRAALANPANWLSRTNRDAFDLLIPHQDDVFNASADFKRNTHATARGFGFEGGVFYRNLDRDFDQSTINYRIPSGRIFRLSEVLDQRYATDPITGYGPVFIDRDAYQTYLAGTTVATTVTNDTNDYRLQEAVTAGHLNGTFTADNFRLMAGFRIERTEFTNETSNVVGGIVTPTQTEFDYTEFLPNVQATWEPATNLLVRLAYTETLARPDFSDFAPGQTVTINTAGVEVITGTNPLLAPRTSQNYDASIEYYIENGFISLGLFRKDLSNETFRQRRDTFDVNDVLVRIETIPLNSGSARVDGLEANFVINRMEFLPGFLSNLGLNANYTLLDGAWNVIFTDGTGRTVDGLRNQPKWLGNVGLNYNDGRLSGSLGYRLRGRTFTGTFGTTAASDIYVDSYSRLDAQLAYQVTDQVQIFAEARNITDTYWVEQTGLSGEAFTTGTSQGRSFWFGVKLKM